MKCIQSIKKTCKTLITKNKNNNKNKKNKNKITDVIDYDKNLFFFDFETIQVNNYFEVYAVGFIGIYSEFYGENAMNDFINYIINNVKNKIFVAYNGGKFDYILLLKDLLTNKNIEVSNYLKNGSRLLGY